MLNTGVAPFWARAQQNGLVGFEGNQVQLFAEASAQKTHKKHRVEVQASPYLNLNGKLRLRELQASYYYGQLGLQIGKAPTNNEFGNNELSTGAFGLGHNALPIPGIQAGFMNYTSVPFTKNWVKIRGWLKHGYFWDDRYAINPWLHEKHGSLRIGNNRFAVSGNIYHYAIWNGVHPDKGQFPNRWHDYWLVFRGKNADYEYWRSYNFRNEFNALGSHVGTGNIMLQANFGAHKFHFRYEKVAEDGSGLSSRNEDYKWTAGWNYDGATKKLQLVFESFRTDVQSGPGIPDSNKVFNYGYLYGGRDDYYNNGNYKNGWTHHGNIIGTPLFMTKAEADQVFDEPVNSYTRFIVNNRVLGWHLAARLQWNKQWQFSAHYTHTQNLGTYTGLNGGRYRWGSRDSNWSDPTYPFNQPLYQNYTALAATYSLPKATLELKTVYDFGDMYRSAGVFFKYSYQLF